MQTPRQKSLKNHNHQITLNCTDQ